MDRLAILNLYEEGKNMPADRGGFIPEIVAYCTLNVYVLAFTVRRRKFFFSTYYELMIDLPSVRSGRPFGRQQFDKMEDAIKYGCDFMKWVFPGINHEINLDECIRTDPPKLPDEGGTVS